MSANSDSIQKIADSLKQLQSPIREDDFDHEIALRVLVNESALNEHSRAMIRQTKGIPDLINYLSSNNDILVMLAALALSNLALDEENQIAIAELGTIPKIAKIIQENIKKSGEATDVNEDVLVKSIHLLTNLTLAQSNLDTVVSNKLIPLLIQLLKTFTHNPEIIAETTKPLRNLMLREDLQDQFVTPDNISHLNNILSTNDENIQENSALLVSVLAAFHDETRKMIIDLGILPMLGNFLGSSHAVKTATLTALNNLSLADEYESNFLSVVPPVVNLLYSTHEDLQENAAALLGNLCSSDSVRSCVQQSSGEVLSVALLQSTSLKVKEAASRLIGNLALDDKMRRRLVMCGAKDFLTAYEKTLKSQTAPPEDMDLDEVLDVVAGALENLNVGSDDEIIESLPTGSLLEFGGRREKIVKEILDTEKSYVSSLSICVKHFSQPLSDFRLLTKEEWTSIFGDIQNLISINTALLTQLQNRTSNWSPQSSLISDIFIEAAQNLRNYDQYINNYDNAIKCFNTAYKRDGFKCFMDVRTSYDGSNNILENCASTRSQNELSSSILDHDLQKNTPQTHKDHELLIEALKQIKEVADHLNEEKRKSERQQRYLTLKKTLTLSSGNLAALFTTNREMIDEGELVLASVKSKKASKYVHVFLFNDLFVYSTKNKDKFKVQNKIQFDDASFQLENLNDTDVLTNAFKIYASNTELIFAAGTSSEKSRWVKSIVTQHRAFKASKNQSLQKSGSLTFDSKTAEEYKKELAQLQKSQTMK